MGSMSGSIEAFLWGIVSALSLPLGAILGLWLRPRRKISSSLMAFGAGSLLFALTIELFGHVPHHVDVHGSPALAAAIIGAICGGLFFEGLTQLLNHKGGYLRRLAYARKYLVRLRLLRARKLLAQLSQIETLRGVQPEDMADLIAKVSRQSYPADAAIIREGEDADALYFILFGEVEVTSRGSGGTAKTLARLGAHDTFGEMGVLGGEKRHASVIALTPAVVFRIARQDLLDLLSSSAELRAAVEQLASGRSGADGQGEVELEKKAWAKQTLHHFREEAHDVSVEEVHEEGRAAAAGSAAMAIWLGILLDGIPESLVIGVFTISATGVSLAFIVGVFLANLPEAMSSSVGMRSHGLSITMILFMWTSICLVTGAGAFIGASLFPAHPEGIWFLALLFAEGLAAGAMLTMIAETMLPEAYEQGGSVTGLSTLAGFLVTLAVKVW